MGMDKLQDLIRFLAERGGHAGEGDLGPLEAHIPAAERAGLVTGGGGWSASYRLTEKGRHAAAP